MVKLERKNCLDRSFEVEYMVGAYVEPWRIWREKKGQDYVTWKEKQ